MNKPLCKLRFSTYNGVNDHEGLQVEPHLDDIHAILAFLEPVPIQIQEPP